VAWAVLPAALLWGASFPLALAAAVEAGHEPRWAVARLYAANTAGAILGALVTSFVLVVTFGSLATQQVSIALAAAAGIALLIGRAARVHRVAVAALAGAAALLIVAVPGLPPELVAYGRFLPTRGFDANVVFVGEGLTASVAVTE